LAASTTKYTARLKPQRVNGYKGEMKRIGPYSPPRWRWNPLWTEDADFFGAGVATWTTDRVELLLRELQFGPAEPGAE
jgi:PIN domain